MLLYLELNVIGFILSFFSTSIQLQRIENAINFVIFLIVPFSWMQSFHTMWYQSIEIKIGAF